MFFEGEEATEVFGAVVDEVLSEKAADAAVAIDEGVDFLKPKVIDGGFDVRCKCTMI